jgi:uncharacterized membrane protein
MNENQQPVKELEVTPNDRTWAVLSWLPMTPLWPILAIVALLMENTKDRPFVRYNAVLSITTGVILIPLTAITLGLAGFLYLVFFYWAYQAYQGETVEVPVVTNWVKERGWV